MESVGEEGGGEKEREGEEEMGQEREKGRGSASYSPVQSIWCLGSSAFLMTTGSFRS